jgi:hypothetical protein
MKDPVTRALLPFILCVLGLVVASLNWNIKLEKNSMVF